MNVKRAWMVLAVLVSAVAFADAGVAAATPAHRYQQGDTDYYLSLGDSLATGFQPDANGVGRSTANGFDHDLLPGLRLADLLHGRDLRLVELGCPGETTTTAIDGGVCAYSGATSQLDAAVTFLTEHRGHVPLVTVTLGANDVEDCASAAGIDAACVQAGLSAIQPNLARFAEALRKADPDAHTRFIGLNEYDPFLAAFLQGTAGQQLATQSVAVVDQLNRLLAADYTAAGFRVADVAGAFRMDDFTDQVTLAGVGQVPVNVANICELTFECAAAPVGPNIHPRNSGYRVLAQAIAARF
jgi:lysophospholipase L1-like esterase